MACVLKEAGAQVSYHAYVAGALYVAVGLLILGAWGAGPFWWFALGGCVLVLVVVTVEAVRSHE